MIEILAAMAGASLTVAAMSFNNYNRRANEGREAVVRLTAAVENVGTRLDVMHTDMKSLNTEVFGRLRELEAAVARLESSRSTH